MGRAVNHVILMGRLTADVELRTTGTGKNVATITLAVDKQSGEGANFFDVTAWEKLADTLSMYTRKGSKVLVQGRIEQQTWEQDGNKRSKVVVVATDVTFLDSKGTEPRDAVAAVTDDPVNLDDIPF